MGEHVKLRCLWATAVSVCEFVDYSVCGSRLDLRLSLQLIAQVGNSITHWEQKAYTFAKLRGTENYKEWAQKMEFALQDAYFETYAGVLIPKNDDSDRTSEDIQLGAITLCQTHGLENLDLLDFGAKDHAHNSRDDFTGFCSMIEEACTITGTGKRIISYGRGNISKKFACSKVTFIDAFYVPTLVNNLYSASRLCHCGWAIDIKPSGETDAILALQIRSKENTI